MSRQLVSQKHILKISTKRLRAAKWNLDVSIDEAMRNDEIVSIGDSQMFRWISELNNRNDSEENIRSIKRQIRSIKKSANSVVNRHQIRDLYDRLESLIFVPDYVQVVIDKNKDLYRACKGFKINGIEFARLLGTNGGVKCSTIVFVNKKLVAELRRRIDNGRNINVPQVPAKLESYRALTCSGSIPVSMPKGILLVKDCETMFKEDIIMLNDEKDGDPEMTYVDGYDVNLDCSDGYGLMLPPLAERWSRELKLDYVTGAVNTRLSWEKGVLFAFDFIDFAENVAHKYIVKDAWGNDVDIRDVEVIMTTSMIKLWNCYDSMEHYLSCCAANKYVIGIAKTAPKELDSVRSLNYQFIFSYYLTDEQIDELIEPTVSMIKDVLDGDYRKALVYLSGTGLSKDTVRYVEMYQAISMMIDPHMHNDPCVRSSLYKMIRKRIDDAKIGVLDVHGNYSIIGGDPYGLCQWVFGLPVTGLLKKGEIYNRYWIDNGAKETACFRAPMSCHNNVLRMKIARSKEIDYWYRYVNTCTFFNSWDCSCAALNGADFDGDICFLTDNKVLVDNIRDTRTIFCIQRTAKKKVATEEDLIEANIASFGDDIGRTTNFITSMYDVMTRFDRSSREFKTLEYRIQSGQMFQQNCIDKTKGIECKPMPRHWYDFHGIKLSEDATQEEIDEHEFNYSIMADKKPYFMKYVYPAIGREYDKYIKAADINCMRRYRKHIKDIIEAKEEDLTDDEKLFVHFYYKRMPVSDDLCVMNRICHKIEDTFNGYMSRTVNNEDFAEPLLSGDLEFNMSQYKKIEVLFDEYIDANKKISSRKKNDSNETSFMSKDELITYFRRQCYEVCNNSAVLADIISLLCYKKKSTSQFAWMICGDQIIENMLNKHNRLISFPIKCESGDFEFAGMNFSMENMEVPDDRYYFGRAFAS